MKSTFLDNRGTTDVHAAAAAAAADGGGYSACDIDGLQLTKYDASGAVQWQQRLAFGSSVATDIPDGPFQIQEGSTGIYAASAVQRRYPGGTQTFLAKFDLAGNLLFTRFLSGDSGLWPRQFILDSSDNIYLLATPPFNSYGNSYFIKIDAKGQILWQSKLGDYSGSRVERIHRDASGNFLIAGSGGYTGNTGTQGFVVKVDPNGRTVWQYGFGEYGKYYSCYEAVPAPDGSVYADFKQTDNGHYIGSQFHKLSSSGGKLWAQSWPEDKPLLAVDSTGNCYATGTSTTKVSPSGTILWDKQLLIPARDTATDSAGNLTLLKADIDYNSVDTPGALKVDPNGNTIWSLGAPDDYGLRRFSRGDIMVSRQVLPFTSDRTAVLTRRVNGSKTILWTSSGITNDHRSEIENGSAMIGGVNRSGTTIFYAQHRYIGINASGQTVFNVPDGTPFYDLSEPYPSPGQILPTKDGGFISHAHPYRLRKYSSSGIVLWEASFDQQPYGSVYEDSVGNLYLQYLISNYQIGVAKLSPMGEVVWKTALPAQTSPVLGIYIVSTDASGNVFAQNFSELWKLNSTGVILWHTAMPAGGQMVSDPTGNLYVTSTRGTDGTQQGWITKYTPNGNIQFDNVLAVGDNSPVQSTLFYKGRLYTVGSTRINGITMMTVFCLESQTGNVVWLSTPNPGNHSGAIRVMVDETLDELRITGWRYSNLAGYDHTLIGMDLNGAVTRAAAYDSGYLVNEFYDGSGADSQHNYYIFGRAIGPSGTYDWNVVKFSLPPPDWASIELPSLATKMATGASYSGTVRVTNTGLNTWTAAGGYKLDCVQPSTWSLTSVPLASGDSIAPGQSKVFSFTVTAPSTPGAYPLTFRMEHSGVQFDNASASYGVQVMTQTNFASFVGQTVPTAMVAGQSYAVSLQYKNTGSNTWTPGTGYKLQSVNALNNTTWGMNRLALLNSSVAPGATGTFSGTVIAPMTSGTYNFQWQPIQDTTGLAFGSPSTNVAVTVTNVGDAARYISKTGAVTVNAGADFYVQNTMMNVGSNSWFTPAGYSLRSLFGGWGAMNMYLPVASVAPGSQVTFTKLLTAPLTPGTYPMQWQMLHGSTLFGDKTPYLSMNVVQGPYNAKFNSQSVVSTSLGAGTTFGCTFSLQNLGTNTWDSTVKLVSIGSGFGVASIPVTGTVVQNAIASFTATFTVPATPGTYTFQFRMQNPSGTFFGQPTTPVTIVVTAADAAQFLSKTGPLIVNAGSDFWVQNTFKNTGTSRWSSATGFSLRSINPTDNLTWGRNRIYLPGTGSVAPGGSVTLTGPCTAPSVPGTYTMQWQMTHGATLFGEKTPALTITVVQSSDNAIFLTQTVVPVSVVHGTTFTVNLAMQNAGTANWGAGYSLAPIGSSTWGLSPIASGAVPPDGQHTFTATCTAPSTPGTYTFQMRMDHSGTKFGQATKLVTVTVT